jgi:methyl coenzyme M reductase alpha subunit
MLNARVATMVSRTTGFVVSKGITGAHNAGAYTRSDFVNGTTYDVVLLAVDIAKNAVEKYIGKQSAPEIINAMQNDLNQSLQYLVNSSLASRVTSSVIQTRDQQILGDMDIELDIVPYGEISTINFRALLHRE